MHSVVRVKKLFRHFLLLDLHLIAPFKFHFLLLDRRGTHGLDLK